MTLTVEAEAPPIRRDADGVYRVGNTRLLLDLVVQAYQRGETPEAIVEAYDVLTAADVYAVIAYYLRHKAEVDAYLAERKRQADEVWQRIEARQGPLPADLLARLLAGRPAGG